MSTDGANCGACGHSCLGGACGGGLCTAITIGQTAHLANISRDGGIALDGTNVYVSEYVGGTTNTGYVEYCPITGCPQVAGVPTATVIWSLNGNVAIYDIVYDSGSGYLYFGDANESSAYAIKTSGAQVWRDGVGVPSAVATDATYVYFADNQGLSYADKLTMATTTLPRIISTISYTRGVAVDPNSGNIWGAAQGGTVVSCTRTGTCSQWTWTGTPYWVSIIGTSPYILTATGGLYKCVSDTDCTQASATQISTETGLSMFSNDATYAYFGYGGQVQRCALTGCTSGGPTVVSGANGNVVSLTNDANWIYWLTSSGYIQKVAK
jgi:hypothetical protein